MNDSNVIKFKSKNSIIELSIAFMVEYRDFQVEKIFNAFNHDYTNAACIEKLDAYIRTALCKLSYSQLMCECWYSNLILYVIKQKYKHYLTKPINDKIEKLKKIIFSPRYYLIRNNREVYTMMLECMDSYRTILGIIPVHHIPVTKTLEYILTDMEKCFYDYRKYIDDDFSIIKDSKQKQHHKRVETQLYLIRYHTLEYIVDLNDENVYGVIEKINNDKQLQNELYDKSLKTYVDKTNPIFDRN